MIDQEKDKKTAIHDIYNSFLSVFLLYICSFGNNTDKINIMVIIAIINVGGLKGRKNKNKKHNFNKLPIHQVRI